ncbi:MAG: M23 family metallopeptidase [Alphaproteobacteria bacterium]
MRRWVFVLAGTIAIGVTVALSADAFFVSEDAAVLPAGDNESELDPAHQVLAFAEWEALTTEAPVVPIVRSVAIRRGDSLMAALTRVGVERVEAHEAIQSLRDVYNPRRDLQIGDELRIVFRPAFAQGGDGAASYRFAGLTLPLDYARDVRVRRSDDGAFQAEAVDKPLEHRLVEAGGVIDSSLFQDGREADIPAPVLIRLIQVYSFDVDFQRELRAGDGFELMFERSFDEAGRPVHDGDIQYAKLTLSGRELPLYLYTTAEGTTDYFNANGESVRKALMKTPIDGARLSSRFGNRRHPILGYTKLHTGADFAAPRGTPIYAAGNGRIVEIGRKGGYGRYIRIRHNGTYQTAYAHMKGYARGMKRGSRVRQGQVIGYVGSSGRSTGPHLHYEVIRDGVKIDPLKLKLPSGVKLAGAELDRFQAHRAELDRRFEDLRATVLLAGTTPSAQ